MLVTVTGYWLLVAATLPVTEAVLSIWQPGRKALLTTDALEVATSAVLEQLVDGEWHPIAFESLKLAASERH